VVEKGDRANERGEQREKMLGEGKRIKWGSVLPERRSTRIMNDGITSLEKAKENKKKGDLEELYIKGKNAKPRKPTSSKHLLNVAKSIGVDLGKDEIEVKNNLEVCPEFDLQRKEKVGQGASKSERGGVGGGQNECVDFLDKNSDKVCVR
jgi:hypothetical protein